MVDTVDDVVDEVVEKEVSENATESGDIRARSTDLIGRVYS